MNRLGSFLIENGKRAYLQERRHMNLYSKIKILLDNREKRKKFQKHLTIVNEWNAENAAIKFLGWLVLQRRTKCVSV